MYLTKTDPILVKMYPYFGQNVPTKMYLTKTDPILVKTYPYFGQNVPTKMYKRFGQNITTFWIIFVILIPF